jgi:hypothetical protein
MPIARHVADFDACKQAGDYFFTPSNQNGERVLHFLCPCGCGVLAGIKIREDRLQTNNAWAWNGNEEKPTAHPSILIATGLPTTDNGHWHGYLTDGEFRSC